jgi:hypothetical protein
LHQRWLRTS